MWRVEGGWVNRYLVQRRFALQSGFDVMGWLVGLVAATFFRYDFVWSKVDLVGVLGLTVAAGVAQVLIGRAVGLYVHRWRYGTFDEVVAAVKVVLLVTPVVTVVNLLIGRPLPFTATVMAGFVSLFVMMSGRFAWRVQLDRWSRAVSDGREPILVFGAGDAGLQIVSAMQRSGPYHPVALLDDNEDLANLRVRGVSVMGGRGDIGRVAGITGASALVIAIPSASGEVVREVSAVAEAAGLRTLVLPAVGELLGSPVQVDDIRPLTEADLLGRREIRLDIDSVAGYVTGRRVLITGAGGSIGSELASQIHRFAPASLVLLDRDESALQGVQLSLDGRGLLDSRELVVGCIRDRDRMAEVFEEHRPEVVFHAAALKHLPLLELHPEEGWKTNVIGTANLLELSGIHGVERFVNISTDKAADPTSALGRTKRLAEQLTADAGHRHAGAYLSVRFGNVLGSRGSVLPLFRSQIERGGPVTVTHPDVTRFFMTIPEACELVIQAGALGRDGEVMVLDMGEQVRIADLAERLIAESHRPIEIVHTGLRPGEKLHEVLFSSDEHPAASEHPMIFRVDVEPLSSESVAAALVDGGTVDFSRAGDGEVAGSP
jgi:FlaA1/EpsC-like NDP-sugar epimerase